MADIKTECTMYADDYDQTLILPHSHGSFQFMMGIDDKLKDVIRNLQALEARIQKLQAKGGVYIIHSYGNNVARINATLKHLKIDHSKVIIVSFNPTSCDDILFRFDHTKTANYLSYLAPITIEQHINDQQYINYCNTYWGQVPFISDFADKVSPDFVKKLQEVLLVKYSIPKNDFGKCLHIATAIAIAKEQGKTITRLIMRDDDLLERRKVELSLNSLLDKLGLQRVTLEIIDPITDHNDNAINRAVDAVLKEETYELGRKAMHDLLKSKAKKKRGANSAPKASPEAKRAKTDESAAKAIVANSKVFVNPTLSSDPELTEEEDISINELLALMQPGS